jgi:hypothetical protein
MGPFFWASGKRISFMEKGFIYFPMVSDMMGRLILGTKKASAAIITTMAIYMRGNGART